VEVVPQTCNCNGLNNEEKITKTRNMKFRLKAQS
jgi:hypothetical protein